MNSKFLFFSSSSIPSVPHFVVVVVVVVVVVNIIERFLSNLISLFLSSNSCNSSFYCSLDCMKTYHTSIHSIECPLFYANNNDGNNPITAISSANNIDIDLLKLICRALIIK